MALLEEKEFRSLADQELRAISGVLDGFIDLTVDLASDILTIEFEDGTKFVANLQGPTRQIWLAADFTAGHFDFDPVARQWVDSKTGEVLRVRLARDLSQKLGRSIQL